jgi:O-antigen ligase
LLFVVAGAISIFAAPNRSAALGLYRAYIIEPILFAFVLTHVLTSARRALAVIAGLGIAGIWVGAPNAVVVLRALLAHTYEVTQTPPVVIYTTANALALFLGPLIAMGAVLLLHGQARYVRVASAVFLAIAVPAMLLSFSRGGYLGMAAVAVGLAITHRRRWLLLAVELAGAAVVIALPPIFHRISLEFQNVNGTTLFGRAGRIELWKDTLLMLREHPIFGAGLSGFAERIAPFWDPTHPAERFIDPHNILLNFWVEMGLLGVVAFAWLLVVAFRVSSRGWRDAAEPWRPIELGVSLGLVALVVHGLVDVPYFKNDLSLEFWTLIGLAWAGAQHASTRLAQKRPFDRGVPRFWRQKREGAAGQGASNRTTVVSAPVA